MAGELVRLISHGKTGTTPPILAMAMPTSEMIHGADSAQWGRIGQFGSAAGAERFYPLGFDIAGAFR